MAKKKRNRNQEKESNKPSDRKVVVTTSTEPKKERKLQPTVSKTTTRRKKTSTVGNVKMLYGKQNFILMGVGALLVLIGLLLMTGGAQAPDQWNPDEVYSFRRMVIAPIVILMGLGMELWAIFKKNTIA